MKKKGDAQAIGILIIFAVIIIFAFFRLTEKTSQNQESKNEKTELETLLEYDFEQDYPKTVRDVMKLYFRYLACIYSKEVTDTDIASLNSKIRNLYDSKLLTYNEESAQLDALKEEKSFYADEKITLVGYTVAEASQIVYDTIEDVEYAKISVSLNLKAGTSRGSKEHIYVLEKDLDDHWKIYGWTVVADEEETEE